MNRRQRAGARGPLARPAYVGPNALHVDGGSRGPAVVEGPLTTRAAHNAWNTLSQRRCHAPDGGRVARRAYRQAWPSLGVAALGHHWTHRVDKDLVTDFRTGPRIEAPRR